MIKFCWHKWGRWSQVIGDYSGNLRQVCECEKCGAVKQRLAVSIFRSHLQAYQVNEAIVKDQS